MLSMMITSQTEESGQNYLDKKRVALRLTFVSNTSIILTFIKLHGQIVQPARQ